MSEGFDFSQFIMEQKKKLIKDLLLKQVDLAKFIADLYNGGDIEPNMRSMFIIAIKNSTFSDYFASFLSNGSMSEDDFAVFFAMKLQHFLEHLISSKNSSN